MLPLLVLLGTIAGAWYLLIVRPQKDQQTRHGRLVDRLQVGDHVLTVGGIYGKVVALEGGSVVLELAPGTNTRIATEGVARIVQGVDAPASIQTPTQTPGHDMQHPHDQQQPQPQQQSAQPAFAAWQAPALPPAAVPAAQPAPAAHAAPAPLGMFRPWGDVAPAMAAPTHHPQEAQTHVALPAPPPPAAMPFQPGAPIATLPPSAGLPPAPIIQPFATRFAAPPAHPQPVAPQMAYAQPQSAYAQPQPVYAPQPVQAQPQPMYAQPQQAQPALQPAHIAQQAHAAAAAATGESAPSTSQAGRRKRSAAPSGMGSNLRLDDPSLQTTIAQARAEREGLANEYRQLTAPLVDITPEPFVAQIAPPAPGQPSPALFARAPHGQYPGPAPTPEQLQAHPASQVPWQEQHVLVQPQAAGMPRPHVVAPPGAVDPALLGAFQRRAPYAPQPAAGTEPVERATTA